MADKTFIWHGPPTAVDVTDDAGKTLWSGSLMPGQPIGNPLPEDNFQIKSWLAFDLIREAAVAPAEEPIAVPDVPAESRKMKKDNANG